MPLNLLFAGKTFDEARHGASSMHLMLQWLT
jgi:hypothetical protein